MIFRYFTEKDFMEISNFGLRIHIFKHSFVNIFDIFCETRTNLVFYRFFCVRLWHFQHVEIFTCHFWICSGYGDCYCAYFCRCFFLVVVSVVIIVFDVLVVNVVLVVTVVLIALDVVVIAIVVARHDGPVESETIFLDFFTCYWNA